MAKPIQPSTGNIPITPDQAAQSGAKKHAGTCGGACGGKCGNDHKSEKQESTATSSSY